MAEPANGDLRCSAASLGLLLFFYMSERELYFSRRRQKPAGFAIPLGGGGDGFARDFKEHSFSAYLRPLG